MRSLLLILSWGSVLFYSTIIAQSISLLDFDSADDQPPLEDFLAFQDSIPLTDTAVSDLDLEDPSFFTDVGTDNISDSDDFSLLDPSILKASCSDENETQPSKLKPRGAPAACDNPALSNQISDPSNLPTSFTGDTVGALSADGYWCYDPQFPLIHPIPVCDQLYPGADPIRPLHDLPEWVFRDSPYHHAVYPGRVITLIDIFACPKKRIYCCAEFLPNSYYTPFGINIETDFPGDDIGAGYDCVGHV